MLPLDPGVAAVDDELRLLLYCQFATERDRPGSSNEEAVFGLGAKHCTSRQYSFRT